jgi:hypothetical protein
MALAFFKKNRKEREVLREVHEGITFGNFACSLRFFLWSAGLV